MGSQFLDLLLVDPAPLQARIRGDVADLVDAVYRAAEPPDERLRPAFEVMARGTFVFLPKRAEHPDGAMYGRAVEVLLASFAQRKWSLEYYPDESESPLWELSYRACEAEWLDLPSSPSGIPAIAWRSPDTCRRLASSIAQALSSRSFNERYSPEATLREAKEALDVGSSSGHGLFTIFQG
ncbi:hypothetical protein [Polyangium fumosum]|uniref:Uncharacterized protein n=1 Tax=Polyangium fumosum TaxID=889272 RepID=A0A4U1J320_9BACT|nr:hypothetical protein [Polyangium fumosum]TKD01540.1 hypothetical protein E8A74_31085 [Polyangium fumosum]